jgi:hypothetical protein
MKDRIKKFRWFLIPGILGFILFFPWRFQNGYTCIADRVLKWNTQPGQVQLSFEKQQIRYVLPFGLFWWASAGMMAAAFFLTKTNSKKAG